MRKTIEIKRISKAIYDYMGSEGCSCCEGSNHKEHEKRIAELLNVPPYSDGSGYDFGKDASGELEE